MSDDYIPISCAFYDELEAAAVKKIPSLIEYTHENNIKSVKGVVVDFKTFIKQEFLILDNKQEIRLDKIISFNGLKPSDKNYC